MTLPNDTYCVFMKEGVPVEAFIVEKRNAKVRKKQPAEVTPTKKPVVTVDTSRDIPEAVDQVKVTIKGETKTILVFGTMQDLKKLQGTGLDSTTWIGIAPKEGNPMEVYAITKDGIKTVGQCHKKDIALQY